MRARCTPRVFYCSFRDIRHVSPGAAVHTHQKSKRVGSGRRAHRSSPDKLNPSGAIVHGGSSVEMGALHCRPAPGAQRAPRLISSSSYASAVLEATHCPCCCRRRREARARPSPRSFHTAQRYAFIASHHSLPPACDSDCASACLAVHALESRASPLPVGVMRALGRTKRAWHAERLCVARGDERGARLSVSASRDRRGGCME